MLLYPNYWRFRNVIMGMGSKIITANHDINDFNKHISSRVKIGNNVWIGSNVVILPGVTLQDNWCRDYCNKKFFRK